MLLIICCKFYSYTLKYKSSPTRIGNGTTMDAIRNYGNTAINTNNISLISVSPIPMNNSWIGAMVLGLISLFQIPKHLMSMI